MSKDEVDAFIRDNLSSVNVSPERLNRLIGQTLGQIETRKRSKWWWKIVPEKLSWPDLFQCYLLPMTSAMILGIILGQHLHIAQESRYFSFFQISSSLAGL